VVKPSIPAFRTVFDKSPYVIDYPKSVHCIRIGVTYDAALKLEDIFLATYLTEPLPTLNLPCALLVTPVVTCFTELATGPIFLQSPNILKSIIYNIIISCSGNLNKVLF